ncbi:lipopolysaccharide biosynthesis protein [Sanguibacter gelidistatuariae]|uniref:lipopolysaccharide biosynthesis protein n=1 Tax=Sanguibacter gelidistatuariae TaxID=1814289 RepID=UPI00111422E2|nr:hypothetical protein [Sanguibacter gelidistatuariae]
MAVGISSIVGYALLAIIGRLLTPNDFGLFVSYWGVLFGLASSLSTIEQEAARQSAEGDIRGSAPIGKVAVAASIIAVLAAAVTLIPPVAGRLYGDSHSKLGFLVLLAVLGFSMQFMVRGLLVGSGKIRSYGALVITEASVRLVALLAIWLTVGVTLGTAAAAVAVGAYAWLGWARNARRNTSTPPPPHRGPQLWRAPFRRAGSLMFAAALTACIITGYPTMVAAFSGGPLGPEGGTVFAALTASRVPLLFVAPLQALAVPAIVRWRLDDAPGLNARQWIIRGACATVAIATIGAAGAWFVGPWAVRIAFGAQYVVASAAIAGLIFSACILALLQLMSAALIAFGNYRWMGIVWASAAGSTAIWLLLSPLSVVGSTVVGALVGPLVGVAVGTTVLWRLTSVSLREPAPLG